MKYHKQKDGEWIQPKIKGYRMMCCDCGLVHKLDFRVIKYADGKRTKIQLRAFRDVRATSATRRKYKTIKIIKNV